MRFVVVGTDMRVPFREQVWVPIRCFEHLDTALKWTKANNDRSINEPRRIYLHLISRPQPCQSGCGLDRCGTCHPTGEWAPFYWPSEVLASCFDDGVEAGLAFPRRPYSFDQVQEGWSNDPWRHPIEWPLPSLEERAR